jgi:hypothetical protein
VGTWWGFLQGYIPSDVKKTLDAIVKRGEKYEELARQIATLDDHRSSLEDDISRIDRCLGSLALSDSGYYAYALPHTRTHTHTRR